MGPLPHRPPTRTPLLRSTIKGAYHAAGAAYYEGGVEIDLENGKTFSLRVPAMPRVEGVLAAINIYKTCGDKVVEEERCYWGTMVWGEIGWDRVGWNWVDGMGWDGCDGVGWNRLGQECGGER